MIDSVKNDITWICEKNIILNYCNMQWNIITLEHAALDQPISHIESGGEEVMAASLKYQSISGFREFLGAEMQ